MSEISAAELRDGMQGFSGTQQYHRLSFLPLMATDGIAWMSEKAGAHWLVDLIASYQGKHGKKPFQVWSLEVKEDHTARVEAQEDSDMKPFVVQKIDYTDFPPGMWLFYVADGWIGDEETGRPVKVLMLTGEY